VTQTSVATPSPFAPAADPLALDPESMRALGHRTVDALVDLMTDPATPCLTRASAAEMAERLPSGPAPDEPHEWDELVDKLSQDVFPYMSRLDHPRYFAYIPGSGTFPGALGDLMASALNLDVGSWMQSAGPSRLELVVLDWFKRWIGYPDDAAGVLVSGGSAANMTALACARESLLGSMSAKAVAYVSDQAHSSLARAARLLGFRPDQVRVLPTDGSHRLSPEVVAAAIDADARAGYKPLFVAGAAGTTNTGAVDPLAELAGVCRERGVWFHVDGAYGAFASLTARGRAALRGIDQADSVTLDPHKWLYQPFECGALLVRDGALLRKSFQIAPDYLKDTMEQAEVNFADRGLQLSRGSRALKVWLSVSFFGAAAFREAIDRSLDVALAAERHIADSDELELLSPASLGVVCFRRRGAEGEDEETTARRNKALIDAFERSGDGLVSSTRLNGRFAIRLCVMNHTSAEEDALKVLDWFANTPDPAPEQAPAAPAERRATPAGEDRWLNAGPFKTAELRAVPLFRSLSPGDLERVGRWARSARLERGEVVTRQWTSARDFYVVLSGRAQVEHDGRIVAERGPGEFFGELAALDWGAGYGYARLATVRAVEPLRLLALSPAHLGELTAVAADVDDHVRRAARDRLDTIAQRTAAVDQSAWRNRTTEPTPDALRLPRVRGSVET
jgi:aromatic-L-amino-acid/L-tryptophan decarboxylase